MKTRNKPLPVNARGANLALAQAMRGKATGAGTHRDRRLRRLRTRQATLREAVRHG